MKVIENTLNINSISVGNCVDIMLSMPAGCVDMIFADPPYNLQLQNELYRPNLTKVDAVDDDWDKFDDFESYDQFTKNWLSASRHILNENGTIWVIGSYHNIHRVGKIMMDLGFWVLNDITWVKTNPMPNFKGTRFTNSTETIIWAKKSEKQKKYTFNHHAMKALNDDKQMRSDWEIPICTGEERIKVNGQKAHSTQKPEQLLYRVIMSSTNPGDVVFDPFMGSGTTAAVAKKLCRRFVGAEISPEYAKIAENRINGVEVPLILPDLLNTPSKRTAPRVAFGLIVEKGYIRVGETLYSKSRKYAAIIKANSHLSANNESGSIHAIGAIVQGAPACNGWDFWYVERGGKLICIDDFRQEYLLAVGSVSPEEADAAE